MRVGQLEEQLRRTERERDILKKALAIFQPGNLKQVYAVITHLEEQGFAVTAVCQALGVSRAGYYAYAEGGAGPREQEDARLRPLVRQIFWEHERR